MSIEKQRLAIVDKLIDFTIHGIINWNFNNDISVVRATFGEFSVAVSMNDSEDRPEFSASSDATGSILWVGKEDGAISVLFYEALRSIDTPVSALNAIDRAIDTHSRSIYSKKE